jgi:hypothetical protein
MPGKCWARQVGSWAFFVNAGPRTVITEPGGAVGGGVTVQPFHTYIEYNGWPAGVLNPLGEGEFAAGTGANVESFVAALAEWDGKR